MVFHYLSLWAADLKVLSSNLSTLRLPEPGPCARLLNLNRLYPFGSNEHIHYMVSERHTNMWFFPKMLAESSKHTSV